MLLNSARTGRFGIKIGDPDLRLNRYVCFEKNKLQIKISERENRTGPSLMMKIMVKTMRELQMIDT